MNGRWMTGVLLLHFLSVGLRAAAQDQIPGLRTQAQFLDPERGLSLDDAIRQALEQEPGLKATRAEIVVAQGRHQQAAVRPNPVVSIEQREEPAGPDRQTMAQMQWPLDLFRRSARLAVADREVEVAQRSADERARLVAAEVRSRYGLAAAAIRDLELKTQAIDLLSRQLALVTQRVAEGAVPSLERDQLTVEVQRQELERTLMVGRVEAALIELGRSAGRESSSPIRLSDSLEALSNRVVSSATDETVVASRPDVQAAEATVRLYASLVDREAADGRFNVTLFGGYTRMDAGFPQRGVNAAGNLEPIRGVFHYVSVGAMVTLPLRDRRQGEVAAAQAEHSAAKLRHEAAQLTARAEIASAEARAGAAARALGLTGATVTLAARNLDIVRQSYELGRTTLSEVLSEQRRYLDIEAERTEAMRASFEAHAALVLARGGR